VNAHNFVRTTQHQESNHDPNAMIDDRTVCRLLDHIACEVFREMRNGQSLY
jgi:hypothetical protein